MGATDERYNKVKFSRGTGTGIYVEGEYFEKVVGVRHNLPGAVILVHGVNDVGTSYEAVERGLCAGLTARLGGDLRPFKYTSPQTANAKDIEADPDAAIYKRTVTPDAHSPVIPFYWGYREEQANVKMAATTKHGQATDRYGNRLDKDYSKGGGTFANATSTLPEMWNRGKSGDGGLLDAAQRDATHPVLDNPGHLYMLLAARRLAAIITMLRDYDPDETVSIVAHSQGCMVSLLAQAFLLETGAKALQANARPADTLILCNPPYSFVDPPVTVRAFDYGSGSDAAMAGRYEGLSGRQTLHGRLSTLANIITGVQKHRHATPALSELTDVAKHMALVGSKWAASSDRDNRGKTYLYFSPEDMTVAFSNVQGIGWQGIPEFMRGTRMLAQSFRLDDGDGLPMGVEATRTKAGEVVRRPLAEMGQGFFQRIFTLKRHPDFHNGPPVLIGQKTPHDFVLWTKGEDDQAHTAVSDSYASKHGIRAHLDKAGDAPHDASEEERKRFGLRRITGEPLPQPFAASMGEGASVDGQGRFGAQEQVDPIDAAIAITSDYGLATPWEVIGDPTYSCAVPPAGKLMTSPRPDLHAGSVLDCPAYLTAVQMALNRDKPQLEQIEILNLYMCMDAGVQRHPLYPMKFLMRRTERPGETRLRWQGAKVARSFHGAIYGGRKNHQNVTAYDVAIGCGTATTHPEFYAYLCAVADWRVKSPKKGEQARDGILTHTKFIKRFGIYLDGEPSWRREIIDGNIAYYSTGVLPDCLPLPPEGFPSTVIDESFDGAIEARQRGKK
jgi:pimeloyl-ACP methyl ester carboxylesterase